jgi:hypothetical protein
MPNVRLGAKADMCSAMGHVRFTPEALCTWRLPYAFVIGDQPEGKAKDHPDVVYNQNDNPPVRGTRPEFS